MPFQGTKSDTLNLRVKPAFKTALKSIAQRENRSMVNALECLVLDYCRQNRLPVPPRKQKEATDAKRKAVR